jgi:hypothetical protein
MFEANLYDKKCGLFKMTKFKSMALLLERAKKDDKHKIKVYNGKDEYNCWYNQRNGWIITKMGAELEGS